jgi:hypothetical protein
MASDCASDLRSGARFSCGRFGFFLAWVLHFRSGVRCRRSLSSARASSSWILALVSVLAPRTVPHRIPFVHAVIFPRVSLLLRSWFIQSDAKDFWFSHRICSCFSLASQISARLFFFGLCRIRSALRTPFRRFLLRSTLTSLAVAQDSIFAARSNAPVSAIRSLVSRNRGSLLKARRPQGRLSWIS